MNEQINRINWPAFADRFSVDNQGRPVSIEIVGQAVGEEVLTENIPLTGPGLLTLRTRERLSSP